MSVVRSRSALGNAVKRARAEGRSPESDPVVLERRRDLAEDKIQEYVLKVVAEAPPLTPEQQWRLRDLLQASVQVPVQAGETQGEVR
jgi:hypothetical protein